MKKLVVLILLVAILTFGARSAFAVSCGGWFEPSCSNEAMQAQSNQDKLEIAVPLPVLQNSLERENISKRLQLFSDPNKVSYIYLISYGKVMAFYTVKGKITSGQKRLTSSSRPVDMYGIPANSDSGNSVYTFSDAPELDGTYGSSSPYIFFWTTSGVYVQWSGEYMMADQPLQLSTPPELLQTVK